MNIIGSPIWQTMSVIITALTALGALILFLFKKEYTKLQVILIFVITTFSAVALCIVGLLMINFLTPSSSPSQVLTSYCNALNKRDYDTVWGLFSSQMQKYMGSEAEFATAMGDSTCKVYSIDDNTESGDLIILGKNSWNNNGLYHMGNHYLYPLNKEDGQWKINDLCFYISESPGPVCMSENTNFQL